ncbi:hypothetical protein [Methylobacterium sp. Leaf87]|uniref:hypothetical protein n=1 Tax=Methylobacterium sp. Leaf87 TaxID=1736243 RepID=UPI0012E7E746|nr:hypothetical protein [Methylobacterium sp. Leaf87]
MDQVRPRQDAALEPSKSLETADSSIGRSFADAVSEQVPSKDWRASLYDIAHELQQLELFPDPPVPSEHSMDVGCDDEKAFHGKDQKDCEQSFGAVDPSGERPENGARTLGVDLSIETGLPRVTTPARDFRRLPQRVADRPRSEEWNDDELLTLPEAAALFWPNGPITTNTLRTAGRDGSLAITKVAGKFFTTPMAIRRMGAEGAGDKPTQPRTDEASGSATLQRKIAEAQRLGGGRARSRRAAKRPVATAVIGGSGQ